MLTLRRGVALLSALGATAVLMLGVAGAAQADCVVNDNSSPCHWNFGSGGEGVNTPNMFIGGTGVIHNEIQMLPTYSAYFTGYILVGGSWTHCGAETYTPGGNPTEICSTLETGETFHVLINLDSPDYSYVYF